MRARILSLILPVILIATASVTFAAPAHAATSDTALVFSQTNAERTKVGLRPLIADPALDRAARTWAQQLADTCTFTHSTAAWRAGRTTSSGWAATGENIAAGYTASNVVPAWMGSSGHRANILNSRYSGVGIGFAKGRCYSSYWVQIFGLSKTATNAGAGDTNSDIAGDVVAVDSEGRLLVYRGTASAAWGGTSAVGSGWQTGDKLVTLGDFSGDGIADVGRIRTDGAFELLRGNGTGGFAGPVVIGSGWASFRFVIGGMDFNGDRRTDVIAITSTGAMKLYRGNGAGSWSGGPTQIGAGWNVMTAVVYAGDFDGDTHGDLIARRSDGTLWLYRTSGAGAWNGTRQIGNGWNVMTAIVAPGDFDGSGKPDILARRSDGSLLLYRGNGTGGWGPISVIGNGWNVMTQIG